MDIVLVNNKKPGHAALLKYGKQGARFIHPETDGRGNLQVVKADFLSKIIYKKPKGDVLHRSLLRHDSDKVARIIWEIL